MKTEQNVSVGHVCIEVSDIAKSRRFYDPFLKHLGFRTAMEEKDSVGFSNGSLSIFLGQATSRRVERRAPSPDEFVVAEHIALLVPDRKTVDELDKVMRDAVVSRRGSSRIRCGLLFSVVL